MCLLSVLYLIPVTYVWLSSLGPVPLLINARTWSIFFYTHFIVFCALGLLLQLYAAVVSRLFYISVLIDFLISVVIFMLLESLLTFVLKSELHSDCLILIPGLSLLALTIDVPNEDSLAA
jgi:hypothetical protein